MSYRCVCLNARSIVNKKNELNIMIEDIDPHIIGITESWANIDITDAELGLTGQFRKDRIGRRGGGVILYVNESIQAYEIKLEREADCDEAEAIKEVSKGECIIMKFADDTKLFRKVNTDGDKQHLQNDLDRLVKWSEKWQMLFNFGKCKCLHTGHRNLNVNYKMGDTVLGTTVKKRT